MMNDYPELAAQLGTANTSEEGVYNRFRYLLGRNIGDLESTSPQSGATDFNSLVALTERYPFLRPAWATVDSARYGGAVQAARTLGYNIRSLPLPGAPPTVLGAQSSGSTAAGPDQTDNTGTAVAVGAAALGLGLLGWALSRKGGRR